MVEIPRAVLSEQFQERLKGRKLVSAVFLTFRFDPAFFEEDVLPVFLDLPLSHPTGIKIAQLDDALKTLPGSIGVYYDENGLAPQRGAAKLDIRRIPVRCHTGIFHPKNVFALVQSKEPDEARKKPRALLVASLSANLTRAGWWENVEVCHIEEIAEGDRTLLRDDVRKFLQNLSRRVGQRAPDQRALRDIREFLGETEQRTHRSGGGKLFTRFYDGDTEVAAFLREATGPDLRGMNLEILSPYFDAAPRASPLNDLIKEFEPREVRVLLPRDDANNALCSRELYEWVRSRKGVGWSHLPKELMRGGTTDAAKRRTVHAKVYRFFSPQPKREVLFIGSANLTRAAHQNGGNVETGFLVEVETTRRPEWWTDLDEKLVASFEPRSEDEGTAASGGTRLSLRYTWDRKVAEAFWDDPKPSPALSVESQGVRLFSLEPLPPRTWQALSDEFAERLREVLRSTSILSIVGEGIEPSLLLVQEEGMSHRPSLLLELSPAEILRYWALLTFEQRAAFLEEHAPEVALAGEDAALFIRHATLGDGNTFFDRFAGIFHAFGCVERSIRSALQEGNEREATYRLFGQKYDSLGHLLVRVEQQVAQNEGDLVEQYVTSLCARQLVQELEREFSDYFRSDARRNDVQQLRQQLDTLASIRSRLIERDPGEMRAFLDWFDRWFLKRAAPIQVQEGA